jgi:hypothetical protein
MASSNPLIHQIINLVTQHLAEQGREGDAVLAHMQPGELVIPADVVKQYAPVFALLMQASGVDPARYVVGGANSINPATGLPEFYDADGSGNAADSGDPTGGDSGGMGGMGGGGFDSVSMSEALGISEAAMNAGTVGQDVANDGFGTTGGDSSGGGLAGLMDAITNPDAATRAGASALGGVLGGPIGAALGRGIGGFATDEDESSTVMGTLAALSPATALGFGLVGLMNAMGVPQSGPAAEGFNTGDDGAQNLNMDPRMSIAQASTPSTTAMDPQQMATGDVFEQEREQRPRRRTFSRLSLAPLWS